MHGRDRNRTAGWGLLVLALVSLGCAKVRLPSAATDASPDEEAGRLFDPATTGVIAGRVIWSGPLPQVPPLRIPVKPAETGVEWPNPHAPVIDDRTRGVKNAVVFLRGMDVRRSRPWDLGSVRLVQQGQQLHVRQGGVDAPVGFVRRGDAVEMISEDPVFHALHAEGVAFFSLTFPDPGRPRTRRFRDRGIVELTSAAGYFWMRAALFVDDHPYYVRTDSEGQFRLPDVPCGSYDLVCWLPDWREDRRERDPETRMVVRLYYQPARETVLPVVIKPREVRVVTMDRGQLPEQSRPAGH